MDDPPEISLDKEDTLAEQSAAEDRLWIGRVRSGNTRAFNFLIRKYQRRLYSVVYNITSNKVDAADLTQEILVKAFKGLHTFKGESHFYTWLYRIALNTTFSFIKKSKKDSHYSLENWDDAEVHANILSRSNDLEMGDRATLLKELQEKLNEALQKLSLNHRTVVVLFEIEGMSHTEIAQMLHCSEGTVRSRLHYAKEQLKQLLKDYLKDYEA
ncbi:MAG: sigma-70 family RNA polymerase sigma factor [Puniceicoccales bacterium]|jgi:RNA polymerase sigma-70 factor (ECF subfamily)|nr:sigma-70 family RNA polymerase sigma factor [Puniceicoccales bacterium]